MKENFYNPNLAIRQWSDRNDLMLYQYIDYVVRTIGRDACSILDVGTAGYPYLDWFDWIDDRRSIDLITPYRSNKVEGISGDVMGFSPDQKFDICTCIQVFQYVDAPTSLAQKLLELGKDIIITVPYKWSNSANLSQRQVKIDKKKVEGWFNRPVDYNIIIEEPLRDGKGTRRMLSVFLDAGQNSKERFEISQRRRKGLIPYLGEGDSLMGS